MYEWVKKYIGIPFVSNGRAFDGCDCYGLVRLVLYNEYGITVPELSDDYANARNIDETKNLFERHMPVLLAARIPAVEEGAIIVLHAEGHPCHLGISAGGGYMLHTHYKTGSICQRLSHIDLRGRIEGYYRVG